MFYNKACDFSRGLFTSDHPGETQLPLLPACAPC